MGVFDGIMPGEVIMDDDGIVLMVVIPLTGVMVEVDILLPGVMVGDVILIPGVMVVACAVAANETMRSAVSTILRFMWCSPCGEF
jgi:hypothetical protein